MQQFVPPKPKGEAVLYLHGRGKQADAAPGGPIEALVRKGHVVLAADLRGCGETRRLKSRHGFAKLVGVDWPDVTVAYMLGKSYVGMRAEDVLVLARHLGEPPAGGKGRPVGLIAIGQAGPPALHAAALEPRRFASVAVRKSLVSWSNVTAHTLTKDQLPTVVHGALTAYDLPDLAAAIGKKLTISDPIDAMGRPVGAPK